MRKKTKNDKIERKTTSINQKQNAEFCEASFFGESKKAVSVVGKQVLIEKKNDQVTKDEDHEEDMKHKHDVVEADTKTVSKQKVAEEEIERNNLKKNEYRIEVFNSREMGETVHSTNIDTTEKNITAANVTSENQNKILDEQLSKVILRHPLNSRWTLYFHSATSNEWTDLISYPELCHVKTLEQFFELSEVLQETIANQKISNPLKFSHGMFFFMREGHPPIWESPTNWNGGYWTLKVSFEFALEAFLDLCLQMIAENLISLPDFRPTDVIGLTYSPKRYHGIIKLWTSSVPPTILKNTEHQERVRTSQSLNEENPEHSENVGNFGQHRLKQKSKIPNFIYAQSKIPFVRDVQIRGVDSTMSIFTKFQDKT